MHPHIGAELLFDNQHQGDDDMANQKHREIGRTIIRLLMMQRLRTDSTPIEHFKITMQQPAPAASGTTLAKTTI